MTFKECERFREYRIEIKNLNLNLICLIYKPDEEERICYEVFFESHYVAVSLLHGAVFAKPDRESLDHIAKRSIMHALENFKIKVEQHMEEGIQNV